MEYKVKHKKWDRKFLFGNYNSSFKKKCGYFEIDNETIFLKAYYILKKSAFTLLFYFRIE
jgi:hypothetical protein